MRSSGSPRVWGTAALRVVGLALLAGFGLVACASEPDRAADVSTGSRSTPAGSTPDREGVAGNRLRITVGDEAFDVMIDENPAAASLVEQLPLTLTFEDYNGVEKIGTLPRALTMEGMPEGDDPEVGDLGYYAPDGVLVIYYGDVGYWTGIARLGRIAGDLSGIADRSDAFSAVIETAE